MDTTNGYETHADEEKQIIISLDASDWTINNEREFSDNLFVGRFNFFLVVFSLFATAGFANNFTQHKSWVFYFGTILLFFCWLLLYRSYQKIDKIMRIIFKMEGHPATKLERLLKLEGYKSRFKAGLLMGVIIPWGCILFFLSIAIMVQYGYIS
ncbi:MAG: hypothetical protein HY279_11855 [Nitrospinae bacterium]|nr:hypothetical protein [Nitrospinota bacterium]